MYGQIGVVGDLSSVNEKMRVFSVDVDQGYVEFQRQRLILGLGESWFPWYPTDTLIHPINPNEGYF